MTTCKLSEIANLIMIYDFKYRLTDLLYEKIYTFMAQTVIETFKQNNKTGLEFLGFIGEVILNDDAFKNKLLSTLIYSHDKKIHDHITDVVNGLLDEPKKFLNTMSISVYNFQKYNSIISNLIIHVWKINKDEGLNIIIEFKKYLHLNFDKQYIPECIDTIIESIKYLNNDVFEEIEKIFRK